LQKSSQINFENTYSFCYISNEMKLYTVYLFQEISKSKYVKYIGIILFRVILLNFLVYVANQLHM